MDGAEDGIDSDCDGDDGAGVGAAHSLFSGYWSTSVAEVGDLDGDGAAEIALGNPADSTSGANAGRIWIFSGASVGAGQPLELLSIEGGAVPGLGFGSSIAGVDDIDGDGLAELAIGAPAGSPSSRGHVYVFLGATLAGPPGLTAEDADATFAGEAFDEAGAALAGGGDFDGDGVNDLLIATPSVSTSTAAYALPGSAIVSSSSVVDLVDVAVTIEREGGHYNQQVAFAGDVDGDGLDDVVVSTPEHDAQRGRVYVLLASGLTVPSNHALAAADYTLTAADPGTNAGTSIASAGDVDGDGLDDLLVGGPGSDFVGFDAGEVYLVLASQLAGPTFDLAGAFAVLQGGSAHSLAGETVAGLGDIDGDGLDDVAVGAPFFDDAWADMGRVYVVPAADLALGGTVDLDSSGYAFTGTAGALLGRALLGPGDVDGDGLADVLVGTGSPSPAGAYVLRSPL